MNDTPPAAALPGQPSVPGSPPEIFVEDFSVQSAAAEAIDIRNYIGSNGMTYYSDEVWNPTLPFCNGWILSNVTPPHSGCGPGDPWSLLQILAVRMGDAQGMSPVDAQSNQVLSAFTNSWNGLQEAGTLLRTNSTIQGETGRFYAVSAQLGAMDCHVLAGQPSFRFTLFTGGDPNVITDDLNPCIHADSTPESIGIETLYSKAFQLGSQATLGFELYNARATGKGNDVAVDVPSILDVTPQLDKNFVPEAAPIGEVSKLTFTITNTSDLQEKQGWAFLDELSDGLVIAPDPNIGGTCASTTTAVAGGTQINISNGTIAAGEASCTITVDVTSEDREAGTFQNCATNLSNVLGVDLPNCASVEFYSNTLTIQTEIPSGRVDPSDQLGLRGFDWTAGGTGTEADALGGLVTTIGSDSGLQTQKFGPLTVTPDQSYRIEQSFIPVASRASYSTGLRCAYDDGGSEVVVFDTALTNSSTAGVRYEQLDFPRGPYDVVCTFTNHFVLGQIEIQKLDRPDWNSDPRVITPLEHAKFQLWRDFDGDGQLDKSIDQMIGGVEETSADGSILWDDQSIGFTYFAEEVDPPVGYDFMNAQRWVTIQLEPGTPEFFDQITDPRLDGTVAWQKVDSSSPTQHLGDSEWTLTGPGVIEVTDCDVDPAETCPQASNDQDKRKGYFEVKGLHWGDWSLVETVAPAGYQIDTTRHSFTISAATLDYQFANTFANVPLSDLTVPSVNPPGLATTGSGSHVGMVGFGVILLTLGAGMSIGYRTVRKRARAR